MLMFLLAVLLSGIAMVLWHASTEEAPQDTTERLPASWFTPMKIGCTVLLFLGFLLLYSLFGAIVGLLAWLVLQALAFFVLTTYVPHLEMVRFMQTVTART